ncbi:unnamed protein product [Arctogadus glacialis]
MSFSEVQAALSGLRSCQEDVGTNMDMLTDVAMDLVESHETEHSSSLETLQAMILESAELDREMNCFSNIVEHLNSEVSQLPPEALFSLSDRVKEQFEAKMASLSKAELHNHQKVIAFKEGVGSALRPENGEEAENRDEDIAVTQRFVNFTCPLTQVEMENPMKNKVCNHHYDEGAILAMIKARHKQHKKFRCPVVGCGNINVTQADLVPDLLLKRRIQKRNASQV